MSVLLDALKKAAEEKKAVNSASEQKSESLDAIQNSNFSIEEHVEESSLESTNVTIVDSVDTSEELPLFDLKISEDVAKEVQPSTEREQLAIEPTSPSQGLTLKLSDGEVDVESDDSGLISLMASLDDEKVTGSSGEKFNHESSSPDQNSFESTSNFELDENQNSNPTLANNNQDSLPEDDFDWSLDKLPGYNQQAEQVVSSENEAYVTNPILVNGENVPPKVAKKYATSTRVILSLVVILLFIGIGFYGLLYYQEQNEELEFSMRKYNLSKMTLPSQSNEQNKQKASDSEESEKNTNLVSDKVISLRNTIKDAVEKNVIQPLSGQGNISPDNIETVKLDDLNTTNVDEQKSKNTDNSEVTSIVGNKTTLAKSNKTVVNSKKTIHSVVPKHNQAEKSSSKGIIVTNSTMSDIAKAYSAYDSQNFTEAQRLFSKVIEKQPNNINALLGLGGVSVANGNFYKAINLYQKVLDNDPNNLYAFESIANLSGRVSLNNEWSSELASMLEKHPKSAVLQYAQGNVFAEKNDWLKAQKNYFNALVLDSTNPDYMLNLAISFDHLGEYKLADKYYTQALGYSEFKQVSFDKKQVKDRLVSIRQFIVKGY
ncbi:tetratricopeptide repeat protein [Thiomicrorhabdus sp.]|uniref:tetratricopeptide repeat protein n=1 Tax=Thiomicrorhabdus sp. TaxID=2039724 RepID=UPI002AA6EFC5|nr:tetratricopeptide repeat protein [Thiomicrorhabdus sp.]